MADRKNIRLRSARDRLVDMLVVFGKTAPVRDVAIGQENLVVPTGTPARIRLDPAQVDVSYTLRHRDGTGVIGADPVRGSGGLTTLSSSPITDDVTYRVLARKVDPNGREVFLHDVAPVREGLDTTLPARIVAPPLVPPTGREPDDSDPRVIDHGMAVEVEIDRTQEGIDYEVVTSPDGGETWDVISVATVRGQGGSIALVTHHLRDDVELLVRATRRFDPSEQRADQVVLLDAVLPLAVRADTTLTVSPVDDIVDRSTGTSVGVRATEVGVTYQVHARPLTWRDDAYAGDPAPPAVAVPVPGEPELMVRWPAVAAADGTVVPPLDPVGPPQPGTGQDLAFDVGALDADTVAAVVGTKEHAAGTTVVELEQPAVVLVRPDAGRELTVGVTVHGGRVAGPLRIAGGEPGVLYYLRQSPGGDEHRIPAYFPDEGADGRRGIGSRRVGYDFVVSPDAGSRDQVVDLGELALPVDLAVRAVRATTRVSTEMARSVVVIGDPPMTLEQAEVESGQRARVCVAHSVAGERYQPFVAGKPMRPARYGNGAEIVFRTEPLSAGTSIELRALTPATASAHEVEKRMVLDVTVVPSEAGAGP